MGCLTYGDFYSHSTDGGRAGYTIDYLEEVAYRTNWQYEYIDFKTRDEAVQALAAGEIDLLPNVTLNEAGTESILYSKSPMCEVFTILGVREDDNRFAYEDFEALEGKRVGVREGSREEEAFLAYAAENSLGVELVVYDTADEVFEALDFHAVDAIAVTYPGNSARLKTVAQYAPVNIYIGIAPARADLAGQLDKAVSLISQNDPEVLASIYTVHLGFDTAQDPVFTRSELEYLAQAPTLKVVYDEQRAPISYSNPETGAFSGISALFFADISRVTGLKFEFIPVANHMAAIDMVESGEADILYGTDRVARLTSQQDIVLTEAYLSSPMAKIVGGDPEGNRIALPEGFPLTVRIAQESSGSATTYYATPKLCFDAIVAGNADAAYADIYTADYLLSESQYQSLSILTLTDYQSDICIGVSGKTPAELASILNRCVQFTSDATITQWVSETSLEAHPTTVIDFMRQYPVQIVIGIIILLLGAAAALFAVYRNKIMSKRHITEIVETDSLTGGWSFARFQSEATKILKGAEGETYAVSYLDIKRFKSFNATFGYADGDRLLISLYELIGEILGENECCARITADQFVVLIKWRGMESHAARFRELDEKLNEIDILKENPYRVLVFEGICIVGRGSHTHDKFEREHLLSELIDCARYACESIEEAPRSTTALYTEDMREHDVADRALQGEAEEALAEGEFTAFYQPTVEIATGKIVGLEALVRWISPEKGLRSPSEFIPLFEKNGFVTEIDLYMFRLACERIRSHLDKGEPVVKIACNFSRLHMQNNSFPETLKRIVDQYQVPVDLLTLEMTENIVMEDFTRAKAVCQRLKNLGFRIAIDDFGSGYSSLGMLQDLPIDVLKLDRTFLMNSEQVRTKAIIEGVISIANKLGFDIIVEGVETLEQANALVAMDPKIIAQGYLYSPPVPREESTRQVNAGTIEPT